VKIKTVESKTLTTIIMIMLMTVALATKETIVVAWLEDS